MDIWVAPTLRPLWKMLVSTFKHEFLYRGLFWCIFCIYVRAEWLDHVITMFDFLMNGQTVSQSSCTIFTPTLLEFHFLPTLSSTCYSLYFIIVILIGVKCFTVVFILKFISLFYAWSYLLLIYKVYNNMLLLKWLWHNLIWTVLWLIWYFFSNFFLLLLIGLGHVHRSAGAHRGQKCKIPWSWNYRWLWITWCRCWELNLSLLQERGTG